MPSVQWSCLHPTNHSPMDTTVPCLPPPPSPAVCRTTTSKLPFCSESHNAQCPDPLPFQTPRVRTRSVRPTRLFLPVRRALVNSPRCSCEPLHTTAVSTLCTHTHAPPSPYPVAPIRGVFGCSGTKRLTTQLRDLSRFNRSQFDCLCDGHCGLWRLLHFLCPHLHQVHSSSDANDGHNPASYPSD